MSEELKSVDVAIHTYVLKFLGTLTAFATATVLLAVQGSIDTEGLASFFGLAFLMASIPFCSAAFVLNSTAHCRFSVHSPRQKLAIQRYFRYLFGVGLLHALGYGPEG